MQKKYFKHVRVLFLCFTLVLLASCSSDDDNGGDDKLPTGDLGTIEFTYTGDEEGEGKGMADFSYVPEANIWSIDGHDALDGENQTFSFSIAKRQDDDTRPETGTYTLGWINDDFGASIEIIEDNNFDNIRDYSTYPEDQGGELGTLEITYSSDSKIEGEFEFKAYHEILNEDDFVEEVKEIEIKGKFSAHEIIN